MTDQITHTPAHHDPGGGFRNPWAAPRDRSFGVLLRWMWSRWREGIPPDPRPEQFPRAESALTSRASSGEIRVTWVGHSSLLIQIDGVNLLTDPHWSRRASPLRWSGPARFVPPGVDFERLPPIDAVLLSHDHYDHLDERTVRRLALREGQSIQWITPLGYREWFAKRGITRVTELDWWRGAEVEGDGSAAGVTVTALPAQHWTRRGIGDPPRLWASWGIRAASGASVYFGGDSGYFPGFREIGERSGPFDVSLLPIGAYDPRWFMAHDHMNPEEAVQAYLDLGGTGTFVGIHWGTFRLTDEDPLEPPIRARQAWAAAGLPAGDLWIPRHGETMRKPPAR